MEVQVILNQGSIKQRSPVAVRTATVQLLTGLGPFQEEGLAKTEFMCCDLSLGFQLRKASSTQRSVTGVTYGVKLTCRFIANKPDFLRLLKPAVYWKRKIWPQ